MVSVTGTPVGGGWNACQPVPWKREGGSGFTRSFADTHIGAISSKSYEVRSDGREPIRDMGTCRPGAWPGDVRGRDASGSPLRSPLPPNRPVASFGGLPACEPRV